MAVIRVYPVLSVANASTRKCLKSVLLTTASMKPLQWNNLAYDSTVVGHSMSEEVPLLKFGQWTLL
jgi:hypothetical protein